ncbi:polysaccharide deacetylase family protein [Oribacterium sp. oral taxon 108]|uniref:polysaccharide deacetylase family protein n=1 Tax=Oribacterium sp. oral taxon 108 TaxID=712414 RepID=UPI0002D8D4E0|nr:polysaccharide deacetylase family protein [Oribacterium sp. oral taxon 108]
MADKRKLGSGEKKFRDRSQNYKSSRNVHSNIKRKRVLTEEEKRILMRRRARRKRQAEQKKARIIFALVLVFCLFVVFQVFAMAFRFIEKSRKAQKEESVTVVESSVESSPAESTEESTEEESPSEGETNAEGMVFSGGRYIDPSKPMVALTFDDGPDVQVDGVLMDELEKVNGRSTFFVVGQRVEKFPEDIKNTVERGHEIGNHSYDHDIHLSSKGQDYIRNEFDKTDDAVEKAAGVRPALVRLPGGNISNDVKAVVKKPLIFWSIDTEDWRSRDAEKTQNSILSQVKDGDIVLMHALYLSTAQACKTVIPELHARGYQLVTVSEMIHFRGQNVQGGNGVQYKNFPPVETAAAESSTASTVAETVKETSVQSSSHSVKESSKSSETKKETKSAKTASKSTESKSNTEATKESGNIVESPGITVESKTVEKSTKESAGNIAGAIDAEDPQ